MSQQLNQPKTRAEILDELKQPVDTTRIAKRAGSGGMQLSYLKSYDVIDYLNEIFGYDGWEDKVVEVVPVEGVAKGQVWRATVELLVRFPVSPGAPDRLVRRCGVGVGLSKTTNQEEVEKAIKEAESDALKRAARTLGNQFGNSLYDKDAPEHRGIQQPNLATTPQLQAYGASRTKAVALGFRTGKGNLPAELDECTTAEECLRRTETLNRWLAENPPAKPEEIGQENHVNGVVAA